MDIKTIITAIIVILLVFIGYNSYSSNQRQKNIEARYAEIESLRADLPQPVSAIKKPDPKHEADVGVDVGVKLEPIDDKPSKADIDAAKSTTCDSVAEFSESVMKARLKGILIQDALGAIDSSDMSAVYKSTFKDVIMSAYKQPAYQTEEIKGRAIREFALKQYLGCVEAFDR